MFKQIYIYILLGLGLISCSNPEKSADYTKIIQSYYKTYQKRDDFKKFLDFYAEDMVLEDMITGDKIKGKKALEKFFDWENPDFVKLDSNTLIITEQIIDQNKVVTKGYFTPFGWGNLEFEAMYFTTILTLNSKGKIVKQVDWINYPNNLLDYSKRKNSNQWIKPQR